jgi:cytochrome c-type biogenesis protein CcmH
MTTFLLVAALMAAIAAAVVAVPLLRNRSSRLVGALAGAFVIGAAAGLYPLWSNWDWNAPTSQAGPTGPEVAAMVGKLERHLADQPNDLDGWLMLGRSYVALERIDEAIAAFDHAQRLGGGKNIEAALGLGEALSIKAGGEVTPQSAELFEQAIAQAPTNPRALLFAGFAAATRGDRALAVSRWEALKALQPPQQVIDMLNARIAELQQAPADAGGAVAAPATGPAAARGTGAAPAAAADPAGQASVNIRIAAALKSRLRADAPLFVFAREPGGQGPPLAAKRLTTAAIGTQIQLSSADAMMPGRALVSGQRVSITARVSFSGQPMPTAGDLYGELTYDVGHDGVRELLIDKIAP